MLCFYWALLSENSCLTWYSYKVSWRIHSQHPMISYLRLFIYFLLYDLVDHLQLICIISLFVDDSKYIYKFSWSIYRWYSMLYFWIFLHSFLMITWINSIWPFMGEVLKRTSNACMTLMIRLALEIFIFTWVLHTYIAWCQLKHFYEQWIDSWYIFLDVRLMKKFVTYLYECQDISWYNPTNVRIFPDGVVFTCSMSYISTVQYFWWKICRYWKIILSVTFLTLIYLKYY